MGVKTSFPSRDVRFDTLYQINLIRARPQRDVAVLSHAEKDVQQVLVNGLFRTFLLFRRRYVSAVTHDFRYVTPTRQRSMTYNFPRAHTATRSSLPGWTPTLPVQFTANTVRSPSVINLRGQQILKCAMMQGNGNSRNTCHYLELYAASRGTENRN